MKPLKVTAILDGPIGGEVPMLDSIIECRVAHRCDPAHLARVQPDGEHRPGTLPIPIARRRVGEFAWPIPAASSPIFVAVNDRHDHYSRHLDIDAAGLAPDQRRVFYTNSGEFKSYRLPLRVRAIARVVWFCFGNGAELRRLLKDVRFLGKKISQGYGSMREWRVEDTQHDYSWFAEAGGARVLMRPLPMSAVPERETIGARRSFGGIVPPYWDARYFAEGFAPC